MVAGEKERGTMASMLVAPIKRSSIVLGKVFALMIISGISSVVYVAVMVGFLPQMMGAYGSEGMGLSLEVGQVLMMAFLLIAIAFLYSGIIVLISVFAKDTKEASSYIMPVYMLIADDHFRNQFCCICCGYRRLSAKDDGGLWM